MDLLSSLSQLNYWSVLLATFVGFFVLGGLWYGPIFGQTWMKELGFTEQQLSERNMVKIFGLSLVLCFVAAVTLGVIIGPSSDLFLGLKTGLIIGICWITTFLGILYLFEERSFKIFLINAGYCVFAMACMGAILGVV